METNLKRNADWAKPMWPCSGLGLPVCSLCLIGPSPELGAMSAQRTEDEIEAERRGGDLLKSTQLGISTSRTGPPAHESTVGFQEKGV